MKVDFFEHIGDKKISCAVVAAQENGQWLFVRRRARRTWEIPGGYLAAEETPRQAAERALEGIGVEDCRLERVCVYSAMAQDLSPTFGVLYYANIGARGALPEGGEIEEVCLSEKLLPLQKLSFPVILPYLQARVELFLQMRYGAH